MFFRRRTQHFVPLELRFRVASPKQRAAISVAPSKLIRNLYDQFSTPQQLWREALFQVKAMNRVKLSSARRLKLCLTVQQRVCTPLDRALDALRKDADGVPEQQAQQALLDLADQMISTLIAGYQIVIDFSVLAEAVRADKDASTHGESHRPGGTALSTLPPLARKSTLRRMLRQLERERTAALPTPPTAAVGATGQTAGSSVGAKSGEDQSQAFRLETGMDRIKQHLKAVFTSDDAMKQQRLGNGMLTGRSSTMGDQADDTSGTGWNLLRESAHHALIQTRETPYTKQLALGTLAIYGIGDQGFARPQLGMINRILRPEPESLYVEIRQLARFATTANILPVTEDAAGHGRQRNRLACLLAYDDDLAWCIVLSTQDALQSGCSIHILNRGQQIGTRLGGLREVTSHFVMFQLGAQSPRLGTPSYPQPHQPRGLLTMTKNLRTVSVLPGDLDP